jgi:TRAP-type mannitol/chloroaromatic compound transport system substrate-binding protein
MSNERILLEKIGEKVNSLTNGRVQLSYIDSSIVASDVHAGTADCSLDFTQNLGSDPEAASLIGGGISGAGYGLDQTMLHSFYSHNDVGKELYDRLHTGMNYTSYLSCVAGPETFGYCKKEIVDLADFQNLSLIRSAPGMSSTVYKMVMGDDTKVSTDISKVIGEEFDCFEWNGPFADAGVLSNFFGFDLKASSYKHVYLGSLHQNSFLTSFVIGNSALSKMSETDKKIVEVAASSDFMLQHYLRVVGSGEVVNNIISGSDGWNGFFVHTLPPGVASKFKEEARSLVSTLSVNNTYISDLSIALQNFMTTIENYRKPEISGMASLYTA